MHEFRIEQGNTTYKIDIQNYKFLVGKDYLKKYNISSLLKNYFTKITNSDFALESRNNRCCYFDEKPINLKIWKYFEISPFFDLETDLKMGTKSLLIKYLESFSEEFEYNDFFTTLTNLITSLNEDYLIDETSLEFGDKKLSMHLGEISRNVIFKEIVPIITAQNDECNSADLSYEELIILQLKIIGKIVSKRKDFFVFINANIPLITPKILCEILGFRYENCFIIINTDSIPHCKSDDIFLCGQYLVDFGNEESVLNLLMELPFHVEKSELLLDLQNFLYSKNTGTNSRKIIELFAK